MTRLIPTAIAAAALAATLPIQLQARESTRASAMGIVHGQVDGLVEVRDSRVPDTGAAVRIRLADRLRTLSQEIPSAACHLHNGVDVGANAYLLDASLTEYASILDALLNGNPDLGVMGGEERGRTSAEIAMIMEEFAPVEVAGRALLADGSDAASAAVLYGAADRMLETTTHLLSELEGEYANPTEILQSDVLLLEISGRQAMATQRLAFEACMIWSGTAEAEDLADMQGYIDRFDISVRALLDGRPELGINPAPTDEIRVALEAVVADWDETASALELILADGSASPEVASFICQNLKKKMDELEAIVDLYTEYSRRAY